MRDVVVVGAGPGGSATAHFLAQAGADVLLVDRADFPRDKTCGDGLTPRALRVLDQMGLLSDVSRHGCAIDGYEVVAPNGRATSSTIGNPYGARAVPRLVLDQIIKERALGSGADFERFSAQKVEQTTRGVLVHGETMSVEARTAVIATGAATGVLRKSGILHIQPRAMLAARAYFESASTNSAFQLRFDRAPWPGYGWIFPVGSDVVNVGVGFLPRTREKRTTTAAFRRFAQHVMPGARQRGPVKGYPIRVDFLTAPTFSNRVLLVGEAAGLVNPLTGEGIDYALESGVIAAQHILTDRAPAHYDAALRERFGRVFRFSEIVRDWYCLPPLLNVFVPLANARPALRQLLTEIVLGEREPGGYGPLTIAARLTAYLVRTQLRRLRYG